MFNFWPFNINRKRREAIERMETEARQRMQAWREGHPDIAGTWRGAMPKPTRPAPPMPRVAPARRESNNISTSMPQDDIYSNPLHPLNTLSPLNPISPLYSAAPDNSSSSPCESSSPSSDY